ncbi:MAG: GspE/PulE family protein [Phycisphaerales bacterium]|nr:GspE/PulE family protein [Phycisphaerales bacterium]
MADQEEAKTVQLVDRVLERAVKNGASDIHIEPRSEEVRVRFRIDGVLVDRPPFALILGQSFTSRLKVMANVDIAERRLPQDGTFRFEFDGQTIDVRMSTFPTEHGEKVVLRLLIRDGATLNLKAIGLSKELRDKVRTISSRSLGMLLITGPTGSGKTSTLYSILNEIDADSRNITTLEDPIEYRFPNVIQGQTNQKIGFTFASGLRSILRQDPDVILVGEMRDGETADIAFKSALTGHLVLSSIHTNSAMETFVRLFDMGLERYVVASALDGLLAQRLVRKLCAYCRQQAPYDPDLNTLLSCNPTDDVSIYNSVGCAKCNGTGFRGRTGIFELIEVDDELNDIVKADSASYAELRQFLNDRGYHGLRNEGFSLLKRGITTLEEVYRVT